MREKDHPSQMCTSDQSGPMESVHASVMEYLGSSELAQQLFVMHSEMFDATDEIELITQVRYCYYQICEIYFTKMFDRSNV